MGCSGGGFGSNINVKSNNKVVVRAAVSKFSLLGRIQSRSSTFNSFLMRQDVCKFDKNERRPQCRPSQETSMGHIREGGQGCCGHINSYRDVDDDFGIRVM